MVAVIALASACTAGDREPRTIAFITRTSALARSNVEVVTGVATGQYRVAAADDETFDFRGYEVGYWPPPQDADLSPISIGKDAAAARTVTVGGTIVGNLPYDATWQEVKSCCDADGLRIEGVDWMASFDLYVENVEDGFAPRVPDGIRQDNTVGFLLEGAYMVHVRDDAVENDDLMSGTIRDSLFDGVNRFLSERPSSSESYSNTGSVVTIEGVLVRMQPMPNTFSPDGIGNGSVFKWDPSAGSVVMRDSIVFLEEVPHSSVDSNAFPPGSYHDVTVVLGPRFDGEYPTSLPAGVTVTRDVGVWTRAKTRWLRAHAAPDPGPGPPSSAAP